MIIFVCITASFDGASFTLIIVRSSERLEIPLLASLLKFLEQSGRIVIPANQSISQQILEDFKLAGFVNATARENGGN